jgi:putative transposase
MPRRRRSFSAGLYHLSPHASDTRFLFEKDAERRRFLVDLGRIAEQFEIGLVAYALMGTHYHLVVEIPDARISSALQRLHARHSRLTNKARERTAHLFRAHCFAREITSDADLLTVCRYIAHNPVEAGIAADPFSWPWSSSAATAGLAPVPVALDLEPLKAALGDRSGWRGRYRAFIESGAA